MGRKRPAAQKSKPTIGGKQAPRPIKAPRVALRRATLSDAPLLLVWRNDAEVRKQSRATTKVPAAAHRRWLSAALADPEIQLFIVLDQQGQEIGTGRLDYRGQGTAELSLTVAPESRGRGFARLIIKALAAEANRLGWLHHVARVKPTNVPSLRVFISEGFAHDGCVHFERGR